MTQKTLEKLKKQLPFQYAKAIASNLDGVSVTRIRSVFKGEVTDPEKVKQVLVAAKKYIAANRRLERLAKIKK